MDAFWTRIQLATTVLVLVRGACVAPAQPFTFTKIVDSDTVMPDAPGGIKFRASIAFQGVCPSNGRVTFAGYNHFSTGWGGIYEWNAGTLARVADYNTPVPQGTGTFSGFGFPDTAGDHIAFAGGNQTIRGLHHRFGGQVARVADESMTAPNGGKYYGLSSPAVEGNSIAFYGQHVVAQSTLPAVYRWNEGTLTTIADTSTAVPGGTGNYSFFDTNNVRLDNGGAWFRGRDAANKSGVYRHDANGLAAVMDTHTDGPAGMGKFTSIVDFNVDGENIILRGATEIGNPVTGGLFTRINGQVTKLLSTGDPAPGGGTFESMSALSIDGGIAVFMVDGGTGSGGSIYTNLGGTLKRIIGPGDPLDGKQVARALLSNGGRDGNTLAISVDFAGHNPAAGVYDEAVYIVSLPAPGALLPFGAAALWAARRSR